MATPLGHQTDVLRFLAALAAAPHRHDFYQTMRQLECLYPARPRWGEALRPGDEPVRLGQDPDLAFAPTPLAAFERGTGGAPPRLQVRLFGLLGPIGPLPTHLPEYARERLRLRPGAIEQRDQALVERVRKAALPDASLLDLVERLDDAASRWRFRWPFSA